MFNRKKNTIKIEPHIENLLKVEGIGGTLETIAQVYTDELFKRLIMAASNNVIEQGDDITYTLVDTFTPYRKGLVYWIIKAMREQGRLFLSKTFNVGGFYTFEQVTQNEALDDAGNAKAGYVDLNFSSYKVYRQVQALFQIVADNLISTAKASRIGKTILAKINNLSEIIENDATKAAIIEQLQTLSTTLNNNGSTIAYIDAQSELTTPDISTKGSQETVIFAGEQISSLTGLSISFITGMVVGGLGNGDHGDGRRDDLAFKRYFDEILNPALYSVYNVKFGYKMPIDLDAFIPLSSFIETTAYLTEQEKTQYIREQLGYES